MGRVLVWRSLPGVTQWEIRPVEATDDKRRREWQRKEKNKSGQRECAAAAQKGTCTLLLFACRSEWSARRTQKKMKEGEN